MTDWIRVEDRLPPPSSAKEGETKEPRVLAVYLTPFFGKLIQEIAVAYYDSPEDYTDGNGDGWKHWLGDHKLLMVTHWKPIPEYPADSRDGIEQLEYLKRYTDRLGSSVTK